MLKHIKVFFVIILMGASLFVGFYLTKTSFFDLAEVRVDYEFTSDYIISLNERILDSVDKYKKISIWKLNLIQIENEIRSESWVQDVAISRQLPSTLMVYIKPKTIVANLVRSPTKMIPVAEDSQLLPITSHLKAPDAPLLLGKEFLRNQSLRESALNLLKELPSEGHLSASAVSEIIPRKNEFEIRIKGSSSTILMNTENVSVKAARVSKVLDYLNERDLDGRVIDSNFSKKVLVKLRNAR